MTKADQKDTLNVVAVLSDLLRMEVDSDTLPLAHGQRLARDIKAIPARYAAVLARDAAYKRTHWTRRPVKR